MNSRFYKQVWVRMTSFTKSDLEERGLMFSSAHLTVSLFGAVEVVALFFRCDKDSMGMEFCRDAGGGKLQRALQVFIVMGCF